MMAFTGDRARSRTAADYSAHDEDDNARLHPPSAGGIVAP
jgi:hypothetical protein